MSKYLAVNGPDRIALSRKEKMEDYLSLGPTPTDEPCLQVGSASVDDMIRECRRYVELLRTMFPDYDKHRCRFMIKTFDHDFGPYREVCIVYDSQNQDSIDFAFNVESNLPEKWDNPFVLATVCRTGKIEHFRSYRYDPDMEY